MPNFVPGYLAPTSTPPLEGDALEDAIHDLIAGITGLDPTLVRPRWQPEPVNIPAAATAWVAFGFAHRETSEFPEVDHDGADNAGNGSDTIHQHETLVVLASFYDLGAGGQADKYLALLRDGLFIAQNREALFDAGGILLISVGGAQPAPTLEKERWLYQVDLAFTVRRQIDRTYGVPNIESANITLNSEGSIDDPLVTVIDVEPPPP